MTYYLLGAESPTAISFAEAYPEKRFVFISEAPIIPGHDLSNVEVLQVYASGFESIFSKENVIFIPLTGLWCKRYSDHLGNESAFFNLHQTLSAIEASFPGKTIPLSLTPDFSISKKWISKGNFQHKPNALEFCTEADPVPDYDENVVYQPWIANSESYLVTGRFDADNQYGLGQFRIFSEAFGKNEQILAAETVINESVISMAVRILNDIDYKGYFSFNIIQSDDSYFVTSFRPYLRSLIYSLKTAGVDPLEHNGSVEVAKPGTKMIVSICYASYI